MCEITFYIKILPFFLPMCEIPFYIKILRSENTFIDFILNSHFQDKSNIKRLEKDTLEIDFMIVTVAYHLEECSEFEQ